MQCDVSAEQPAGEVSLGRACRVLMSLKWNLLRNGLTGRMQLRVQTWLSLVTSVLLGLFGFAALAGLGRSMLNGDLLIVIVIPVMVFGIALLSAAAGVEVTIDVRNLATEPIGPHRLGTATLAAAVIGPPAILAGLSGGGLFVGFTVGASWTGRLVVAAVVVGWWATLLLCSRTAANVLGMLAHGRTRHVAQTLAAFAAIGMWLGSQLAFQAIQGWDRHQWLDLARVFAWSPPGQLGRALAVASSDPAAGSVHLLLGVLWLPVLWWIHGVSTGRLAIAPPGVGAGGRRIRTGDAGVRAGVLRALPPGRATAVGARTLRTKARTPREAVNTVVALFLGMGALLVAPLLNGSGGDGRYVLTAGLLHFAVLFESSNAFGFDGPALWMEVAAGADGGVLARGKAVSSLVTMALPAALLVAGLAVVHRGWSWAPAGALLAAGSVMMATGASVLSAAAAPFAVPESPNPFAAGDAGQGCLASTVLLIEMVVLGVISLPMAGAVFWASTVSPAMTALVSLVVPAVGALVLFAGIRLATGILRGREDLLVAKVTPAR